MVPELFIGRFGILTLEFPLDMGNDVVVTSDDLYRAASDCLYEGSVFPRIYMPRFLR